MNWKVTLLLFVLLTYGYFRVTARSADATTPAATNKDKGRTVRVIVTSTNKRLADTQTAQFVEAHDVRSTPAIALNPDKTYQEWVGMGAAFTDAACYMFNQLTAEERTKLFHELFSADGLGLNLCRVPMGSSDYATHAYSYCDSDTPDPELKKFNIDHDRKYILPQLQEVMKINPDMWLLGSPWSPPGWMKPNGSMLGGNMNRRYLGSYAQYFVKFVQAYAEAGVPIRSVTVQNEVDTDQDCNMPACTWPQEIEQDFVANHLGPAFEKAGINTQIWVCDHNYNLWGRVLSQLESDGFRKYCKAVAWHGYVGDAGKMTDVHNAHPEVDTYWTEGGPDITDPNYALDWVKWSKVISNTQQNWARGWIAWNLSLNEEGKPNIGPFPCGGLVTIDSKTHEITRSGQYYAVAQYSRYIHRGARRIQTSGPELDGITHIAFLNPDGQKVAVITNSGEARSICLQVGAERTTPVELEPNSVTTFVW